MTIDNPTITTTNNGTIQLTSDNYINNITLKTNVKPSSQTKTINITENGTTTVTPDNNIPYLDSVIINTNVQPTEETINKTYTESGYYEIKKTDNYYLKQVNLTINIPQINGINYSLDDSSTYDLTPQGMTINEIQNAAQDTTIFPTDLTYTNNVALIKPLGTYPIRIDTTGAGDTTIIKHKDGGLQIEEGADGKTYRFYPEKSYCYLIKNADTIRLMDQNNTHMFSATMKAQSDTIDSLYITDSLLLTTFKNAFFPTY
ncbi:hypothetical protein EDI_238450 [Entamoeba dispar SAW760]|uniref:Uncharacterized protein n=1 Tax=Entamoeba dispar (strain ATCC PRA-260 / SAW760) TaxID=370354 RepID=B0EA69_ENTDS|nr:uncharacterized protein EDI_238450 [Entamoeba dispar SAW760]EDR28583.1 hypothetical protein EDI_238450 [Entamoeba dispar SAW760]|eukprot:EDR28583.1 hypothetical protein EDI_238450 [Entamoeba dispar SAW760]